MHCAVDDIMKSLSLRFDIIFRSIVILKWARTRFKMHFTWLLHVNWLMSMKTIEQAKYCCPSQFKSNNCYLDFRKLTSSKATTENITKGICADMFDVNTLWFCRWLWMLCLANTPSYRPIYIINLAVCAVSSCAKGEQWKMKYRMQCWASNRCHGMHLSSLNHNHQFEKINSFLWFGIWTQRHTNRKTVSSCI